VACREHITCSLWTTHTVVRQYRLTIYSVDGEGRCAGA